MLLIHTGIVAHSQSLKYSGDTITSTINVSNLDTLIIDNCLIENISDTGVRFHSIDFVQIKNSVFKNISNGAIRGSASNNIIIEGNVIDSISYMAILLSHSTIANNNIIIQDNTISNIRNSTAETGNGIRIYNADSVLILNNTITYCEFSGIAIGRNSGMQNQQRINYLLIDSNTVSFTLSDGISVQENVIKAIASNNIISNVAYDGIGGRPLEGDHGLYWQAPDGLIEGNEIYNILDNSTPFKEGVGISVRTSAKILRNKVYQSKGRGIAYFNDHNKGTGPLTISNNIIYDNLYNGIYINGSSSWTKPNIVHIYNNTVVSKPIQTLWHHSCPIAIRDMVGEQEINGNIMIYTDHPDSTQVFWNSNNTNIESYKYNIQNTSDIGFVNFANYNLELTPLAISAIEQIPEVESFVSNDYYNNERFETQDIGAIEFSLPTSLNDLSKRESIFRTYPNPSDEYLMIEKLEAISVNQIIIITLDGKAVLKEDIDANHSRLMLHIDFLENGYYILNLVHENKILDSKLFIKNRN